MALQSQPSLECRLKDFTSSVRRFLKYGGPEMIPMPSFKLLACLLPTKLSLMPLGTAICPNSRAVPSVAHDRFQLDRLLKQARLRFGFSRKSEGSLCHIPVSFGESLFRAARRSAR